MKQGKSWPFTIIILPAFEKPVTWPYWWQKSTSYC